MGTENFPVLSPGSENTPWVVNPYHAWLGHIKHFSPNITCFLIFSLEVYVFKTTTTRANKTMLDTALPLTANSLFTGKSDVLFAK